jgi:hypothetical protein
MKTFGFVTHLRTYVLFNNELSNVPRTTKSMSYAARDDCLAFR